MPLPSAPKTRSRASAEPALDLAIANETDAGIPDARIRAAVEAVVAGQDDYRNVAISIAVVDDRTIQGLNQQFLEHDYETDVLSFVLEDEPPRLEGEIIVSRDTAERCAADAGWSGEDELLLYVIHGALHLVGHRDKAPNEAAAMIAGEARALDALGIVRSPRDVRWRRESMDAAAPHLQESAPS
jgi:probable rRNA maturation factor